MTLYIRNIPNTLHTQFKAICIIEGKTLQTKITELLEQEASRPLLRMATNIPQIS